MNIILLHSFDLATERMSEKMMMKLLLFGSRVDIRNAEWEEVKVGGRWSGPQGGEGRRRNEC